MSRAPDPPEALAVGEGECLIFDPEEFRTAFDAIAAIARSGELFVLTRTDRKWVNVEAARKTAKGSVSVIRGGTNGTD